MKEVHTPIHQQCVPHRSMKGFTLVEMLVSLAVAMIVVLAASALFVSAKSGYVLQSDGSQVLDTGRYALEIITRSLRQAGLEDWDAAGASAAEPGIRGLDARSLKTTTAGIDSPVAKSINGSDVLAIHFAGSGKGDNGDGSVLNCAGFGVAGREAGGPDRGWSIFYVAEDGSGEPELYCKYRGEEGWTAQAIARGVESFQVLYVLDSNSDGVPDSIVSATALEAMYKGSTPSGPAGEINLWRKVVAVKVALLVRGAQAVAGDKSLDRYDLFGKAYSDAFSTSDPGVRIQASGLPKSIRNNVRRMFAATIRVRNSQKT